MAVQTLVALHCALPQDYLSDTSLLRAMGSLASQNMLRGAIAPRLSFSFISGPCLALLNINALHALGPFLSHDAGFCCHASKETSLT